MLSSRSTPRVNFELMERFVNRRVILVGQVDHVENGKARLKTSDGAQVSVELFEGNPAFNTPYVEFQGVVTSATSLREESRTDFGTNFEKQ